MCIAYDGTLKPCCNVYFGEIEDFGNANEMSLQDLYFSEKIVDFRRQCFAYEKKPIYCQHCNVDDNSDQNDYKLRLNMLKRTN